MGIAPYRSTITISGVIVLALFLDPCFYVAKEIEGDIPANILRSHPPHHRSLNLTMSVSISLFLPPPQVVKEIAGEEGMTLCRSLLDGIEDDGDSDLQGRVTDGRCTGTAAPVSSTSQWQLIVAAHSGS